MWKYLLAYLTITSISARHLHSDPCLDGTLACYTICEESNMIPSTIPINPRCARMKSSSENFSAKLSHPSPADPIDGLDVNVNIVNCDEPVKIELEPESFQSYESLHTIWLDCVQPSLKQAPNSSTYDTQWTLSPIESLDQDFLSYFPNLRFLTVRNISIPSISSSFLHHHQHQVKSVILVDNNLTEIEDDSFRNFSNLKYLHISQNELISLNSSMFDGLETLEFLTLSDNGIEDIEDGCFDELGELVQLYISNNHLEQFPVIDMERLKNLRYLDLHNNRITTLLRTHVQGFRKVSLHLGENWIHRIEPLTFDGWHLQQSSDSGSSQTTPNQTANVMSHSVSYTLDGARFPELHV